jgi:hypothetical protein
VLVCRYHEYAVRNLASHLRLQHKVRSSERSAIEEKFSTCELLEPAQVATPLPLEAPFHWLGAPCEDFSATNPDAARSQRVVTRSGNIVIKNTRGSRMSTTRNTGTMCTYRRCFSRKHIDDTSSSTITMTACGNWTCQRAISPQNEQILEQWDRRLEAQEEAMQLAEAVVAKTDHTLWFKRNKWPQHLAESNLRHLSRACRMPR